MEHTLKLSERLKELRTEKGLTQRELAARLGLNGVTYLHYEKGQREPPLSLLLDFAGFFGVSVDYLLGYAEF
jgi:transcriptional regulator with XRE-family HTH domain